MKFRLFLVVCVMICLVLTFIIPSVIQAEQVIKKDSGTHRYIILDIPQYYQQRLMLGTNSNSTVTTNFVVSGISLQNFSAGVATDELFGLHGKAEIKTLAVFPVIEYYTKSDDGVTYNRLISLDYKTEFKEHHLLSIGWELNKINDIIRNGLGTSNGVIKFPIISNIAENWLDLKINFDIGHGSNRGKQFINEFGIGLTIIQLSG